MAANRSWILGVDIGTTFCVAAARPADGRAEIIEVAGQRRVPSVIVLDDSGQIVVGQSAENLAAANPSRAVRAPKSRLGDPAPVVIGGRVHDSVELVAALLRHLYDAAVAQQGGEPSEVRLTHPAIWGRPRLEQLRAVAERAGLKNVTLVAEPVAAAVAYAAAAGMLDAPTVAANAPRISHVAVYDLGGGTFDTAVLAATAEGFAVVGRPVGEDRLGGELFDELLANHVGQQLDADAWENLQISDDLRWQQAAAALRTEARRVKEALSSHDYAELMVALPNGFVQHRVTRDELEGLMRPYIEQSVDRLVQVVADAGLAPGQLDAICLAGGASHAPAVERAVRAAFPDVAIARRGDPKTAVALGATLAVPTTVAGSGSAPPGFAATMDGDRSPTETASGPASVAGMAGGVAAGLAGGAPAGLAGGVAAGAGGGTGPGPAAAGPNAPAGAASPGCTGSPPLAWSPGDARQGAFSPAEAPPTIGNAPLPFGAAAGAAVGAGMGAGGGPGGFVPGDGSGPLHGQGPGSLTAGPLVSPGSVLGRRGLRGWPRAAWYGAAALALVIALVGTLVLTNGGGGSEDSAADLAEAQAAEARQDARRRRPSTATTTATLPPSTTVATLASLVADSPKEQFLGTEISRHWSLDATRDKVTVTVTLTNAAAGTFRWHHDEVVPAGIATDQSQVKTEPVAEVVAAGPTLRWWYELAPRQSALFTYTVARQPAWPASASMNLTAWENARAAATAPRQAEIMKANNLADRTAAPVPVTAAPPVTGPPAPGGGNNSGGGTQPTNPPVVVVVTSPPAPPQPGAPTVQISGPSQLCAGRTSYIEGVATGAVSGVWTITSFTIADASWSPGSPGQYLTPSLSAAGSTFRATLQVVNSANVAASALLDFTVVHCTPQVYIDGPTEVCAGDSRTFSGLSAEAVSGQWDLPEFNINDASWSPDLPTAFASPNINAIGLYFTWTLTVFGPTGLSASAQFTFLVMSC